MIDQFVGFCLHRRVAVIILAVLLVGSGVYAWETLSVEAYPELGDVATQVTTQMPGLAPEEVEQVITVPLERQINGTPGRFPMRSPSHFGLGITDVINAINNNNTNAGGGRVSRGDQSYVIRGVGLIHNLAEIGSIVVTQVNGTPVLVRDMGRATLSHQEREGIVGKDANPDTLAGIVLMLKYQNPSRTLAGVHAKVAELNRKLAKQDVRIVPYIDRYDLVHSTLR